MMTSKLISAYFLTRACFTVDNYFCTTLEFENRRLGQPFEEILHDFELLLQMMNSQERIFYRFGVAIGENARLVLVSTILITTICSAGLYKFRIDNNIRDYAPYITQSSYELDVAKEVLFDVLVLI